MANISVKKKCKILIALLFGIVVLFFLYYMTRSPIERVILRNCFVYNSRCSKVTVWVNEIDNSDTIRIRFQMRRFTSWEDMVFVNKEMLKVIQGNCSDGTVEMGFKEWGGGPDYIFLVKQEISSGKTMYINLAKRDVNIGQVVTSYSDVSALQLGFRCFTAIDQLADFENLRWIFMYDVTQTGAVGFTEEEKAFLQKEFPGCEVNVWRDWE